MLRAALRYPTRGEGAVETLLVGGGLHLLSAFVPVVPLVFALGYLVRVLAETGEADPATFRSDLRPPGFERVRRLFVDGLAAALVVVVYLLAPLGVLSVTVGGALQRTVDPAGGSGVAIGVVVGSTAALAIVLAFAYLLPAALASYARNRRLVAAFAPSVLRRAATDAEYFVGWVGGAVAIGVAGALFEPLNAVALGFFVLFYAEVVAAALWGRVSAPAVNASDARRASAGA